VNIPVRYAARITLACALSMVTAEILRYPHAVRAILCASLVASLPTFRRALMRQRFLLVWLGGIVGMGAETLFRDAVWFFLPAYFLLVVFLFRIASKSRDFATMTIVGYGLSGSLDNMFTDQVNEPIFGGFYRALYCSVGLTAAAIAFLAIPVRKPPASSRIPPKAYPMRDLLFLGFCACTAEWIGVVTSQYFASSFIVLMSLTWGVQLCTIREKSDMVWNLITAFLGLVAAVAFDIVVAFSTNNFGVYMAVYLLIIFSMHFMKASYPKLAPRLALFTVVTSAGILMVPAPIQSYQGVLRVQLSMLAGIAISTVLWFIDRTLRSAEESVVRWGVKREAGV
jgi:hypothetical protein